MAALPNGRVGGETRASSSPARPPARVDRSAPQVPRALPGRRRAPPGPAPLLSPFLSGFALSSSPAVPAQHLAASLWQTEGLDLRPTLVFVLRPSSAAAVEAAKPPTPPRALFFFTTTPSPNTATGVFGLSPLHSACVGEMFPVPEGMKGLGLVSMATGRKRWVINPSPPSCD